MLLGVLQGLLKDVKHMVLFCKEMVGIPIELFVDQDPLANKYKVDIIRKFLRIGDLLRQPSFTGFARTF